MTSWRVGVVVPAHDEAATVRACLLSIRRAIDALAAEDSRRACIVLVADRCSDATAQIAASTLRTGDVVLDTACRSVGDARRRGTEAALRTLDGDGPVWLASTDADTTVPRDWLVRQLRHADGGVAAVAGTVRLTDATPSLRRTFERRYRRGITATSHHHVHAANLSLRGDVYDLAGGWSDLATGEDHDLWTRVRELGATTVSDPLLRVRTSARLRGRAPDGFAADLMVDAAFDRADIEVPPPTITVPLA